MTSPIMFGKGARCALRVAVWAIIALTLYFFFAAVGQHWSTIATLRLGWQGWSVVLAVILSYAIILILLAELWHQLVQGMQDTHFTRVLTYPSYSRTQLAKYLPGNVFQFVGRHLVMTRHGAAQAGLALANLLEISTLAIAAGVIILSGIAIGLVPQVTSLFEILSVSWIAIGGVILTLIAAIALALKLQALPPMPPLRKLILGLLLAVLFFLNMGLILLIIVHLISGQGGAEVMFIAVISWLAGYITPGAPGGIGVREFVMLFLLRPLMPEADALIVVGLFRLTTTFGDLVFFAGGEIVRRPPLAI